MARQRSSPMVRSIWEIIGPRVASREVSWGGSSDGPAGRVDDAAPVAVGGHGPGGLQPLRAHARVGRHGAEVLRPGLVLGQGLVQDGAGSGGDELLALVQRALVVGVGRRRGGGDEAGDEPAAVWALATRLARSAAG